MSNTKHIENPKDVSRFTRWVNGLDEKDKSLDPLKRKSKWIVITATLFTLFGISFIWFPKTKVSQQNIATPQVRSEKSINETVGRSAFEMPVDSFENHLKHIIHEGTSETK